MTDEEMADKHAEEYVMREDVITENDRVPFDNGYGFQTVSFEDEVKKGYKEGFLAGLKAGRPQWHDLRKDPDDLPEDKEYVLVYTNLTNYYVAEKVENHFMSKGWGFIPMSTVIAWCEIPTFDKE